jgi:hypothetical protein
MNVFDRYPLRGRTLLGRPKDLTGACRSGYGLGLQRLTGETSCAYCGVSLIDDYHHWLLMSVDHVVPGGEARRVGIDAQLYEDAINLVLCCSGCNGFGNRYRCVADPQSVWTLEGFLALRDRIFAERFERIAARRAAEIAFFESGPWQMPVPR